MSGSLKIQHTASFLFAVMLIVQSASSEPGKPQVRAAQTLDQIELHVTVTGKDNAFVNGLRQDNFEVVVDKQPARIVSFRNQDSPAAIGIVLDFSGSMASASASKTREEFLNLRKAVKRFLELSNSSNEYFLMAFNRSPQLLADWTSDHAKLTDSFDGFTVRGGSALYDACYLAVDKLQASQHSKRVLLLISDGQDTLSRYTFRELRELIRGSGVVVYSVVFAPVLPFGFSSFSEAQLGILDGLSTVSGGGVWAGEDQPIKSKHLVGTFELIAAELRHQYSMAIISERGTTDKSWRKIKVSLKSEPNKKAKTRTRQGYYSSADRKE